MLRDKQLGEILPSTKGAVTQVTVIDYKAGNLTSVVKALRHLDAEVVVTDRPEVIEAARRVLLPGVGHFAATRRLDEAASRLLCAR